MQIGRLFHKKLQKNTRKILESKPGIRRDQTSTQVRPSDFFNFLQKIDIFRRSFIIIWTDLDKCFHIVSKKIMVDKSFRIFVFLNEATLIFFTFCSFPGHFRQIICSNFILMFFKDRCRIYRRFQNRSWIQNPSIPSRDIPIFLAQLLQNRRFLEKSKNSKIVKIASF